jgi:hypothetical protein
VSDSYLGATEGELLGAPLARHLAAHSDQRRLFPHHGPLQLTPRTLILSGWRVIRREAVAGVRLTFTGAYRRSQAAGIRGNNASFGLFGDLGKPLVLDVHDDEPACLPDRIPLVCRHQPGSPTDAGATHVVLRAGVRIMRRRLTTALILAALIVVCVSGCHFVTVHTSPARHGSAARR